MDPSPKDSVQVFGKKKTAIALALCKRGQGLIKINGCPIELLEPEILRVKSIEPVLLLGKARFEGLDIRIRVKGGGKTSQIYAIRQAIAKSIVAFYQKCNVFFFSFNNNFCKASLVLLLLEVGS